MAALTMTDEVAVTETETSPARPSVLDTVSLQFGRAADLAATRPDIGAL